MDRAVFEFSDLEATELNLKEKNYYKNLKITKAKIDLSRKALGISADFNILFSVGLVCARCLTAFTKEFDENLHLDYIAGKDPLLSLDRVELKSGDIDRVYYTGSNIDLGIGIREAIILVIPARPLCKQDCSGLCPICGQNLNNKKCNCSSKRTEQFTPGHRK